MPQRDTIAAIATPAGSGGVAVIRLSGQLAAEIARRMYEPMSPRFTAFQPYKLHHGYILAADGTRIDDGLVVVMPGPKSFTGEDVAEIQCHGGPYLASAVLDAALALGARLANRGEFSRRAYINGRMDLTQAEAVAELIAAPGKDAARCGLRKLDGMLGKRVRDLRSVLENLRMQVCAAVDFPEEEADCLAPEDFVRGVESVMKGIDLLLAAYGRARVFREGAQVVLAGSVNVGKSSLLNALIGRERALVTNVPGTTRDFLEEVLVIDGLPVRLVDTAGLRETAEPVEKMGVSLSRDRLAAADVIVLVVDGSLGPDDAAREIIALASEIPLVLVWNKSDLVAPPSAAPEWADGAAEFVAVSALTGDGLENVSAALRRAVLGKTTESEEDSLAPNARQAQSLNRAKASLTELLRDIERGQAYDILAVLLDAASAELGEAVGLDSPKEVLDRVFSTFCIGK